jgi:hypothetical protein
MITVLLPRLPILFLLFSLCFLFPPVQGKLHSYTKQRHLQTISRISLPPAPAPDPEVNFGGDTSIFNVLSFGAIGNGVTDDTQAFKMAWDTACQAEESGILLVPKGYSFMMQTTIFTGPCNSGIIFQVILAFC